MRPIRLEPTRRGKRHKRRAVNAPLEVVLVERDKGERTAEEREAQRWFKRRVHEEILLARKEREAR